MTKDFLSLGLTTHAENARYLAEFFKYYSRIGVERFYVNVNGEGTDVEDIYSIAPYIEIERFEGTQLESNERLVKRASKRTEWLVIVDDDEFIVPFVDGSLTNFIKNIANDSVDEIVLSGYNFGNSGYDKDSYKYVTERFRFRSVHSTNTKSIVRPTAILSTEDNNHSWNVEKDIIDEQGNILDKTYRTKYEFSYDFTCNRCWINHYIIKSTEECYKRYKNKFDYSSKETFEKFFEKNNENDVYDNRIKKLIERIERDNAD